MCLKSISPTRISVPENCSSPIFFITMFSAPGTLPGMQELSKVTYFARGKHVLCSWTACMARCASHRLLPVRHPRGTEECVALAFRSSESRWEWGREWPITLHCLKCQQMWIGWVLWEHRGGGSDWGLGSKGSPSGDGKAWIRVQKASTWVLTAQLWAGCLKAVVSRQSPCWPDSSQLCVC